MTQSTLARHRVMLQLVTALCVCGCEAGAWPTEPEHAPGDGGSYISDDPSGASAAVESSSTLRNPPLLVADDVHLGCVWLLTAGVHSPPLRSSDNPAQRAAVGEPTGGNVPIWKTLASCLR